MKLKILFLFIFITGCELYSQSVNDIKFGIDVLAEKDFKYIKGKKIALFANLASQTSENIQTLKVLKNRNDFILVALFTPEHGYFTTVPAGKYIEDTEIEGVKTYSLYNVSKSPKTGILSDIDIVIADIQDIGIRSYTYISTLYNLMDACAKSGTELMVLDRPNPLGGEVVDGNTVEPEWTSFVSKIPVSYIHGCTIGELAIMINEEGWLEKGETCKLSVIKMNNWERWMHWEDTGVKWTPTSPHIPTVDAVRGMATLGMFGELGFINIGIGTTLPFQYIGSPDLKKNSIYDEFTRLNIKGLELEKIDYYPFYALHSGKTLKGFLLRFYSCCNLKPYSTGFEIMFLIKKYNPELFNNENFKDRSVNMFKKVTGTDKIFNALINNESNENIRKLLLNGKKEFEEIRKKYLLYD